MKFLKDFSEKLNLKPILVSQVSQIGSFSNKIMDFPFSEWCHTCVTLASHLVSHLGSRTPNRGSQAPEHENMEAWQYEIMYGDLDKGMELLRRKNAIQDRADGMLCDCDICSELDASSHEAWAEEIAFENDLLAAAERECDPNYRELVRQHEEDERLRRAHDRWVESQLDAHYADLAAAWIGE
mgnify:CR=1 FL=1